MSAIASFYLVDASKLDDLKQNAEVIVKKGLFSKKVTDNYYDYLANNATALSDFQGSGFIYGNLFVYLEEEKNINLLQNEYDSVAQELGDKRESGHFLFTNGQRKSYIDQLDPAKYSLTEIQKFNQEFSEDGDEEIARLTLDAIRVLRDNLSKVQNDNQVMLLIVG